MRPGQGTRAANRVAGATAVALPVLGLATSGWMTVWAGYAWAARDVAWLLSYGTATFLALALPVAFLGLYGRWQVRRGLYDTSPRGVTRALNWSCGLFATLLGLLAVPFIVLSAYFAWAFWTDGRAVASVYFAAVALADLAVPVAFLLAYDRWQTRNGLQ